MSDQIPEGWRVGALSEFADINPKLKNDVPLTDDLLVSFIKMEDVSNNAQVIRKHVRKYSDVAKGFTKFNDNDVLVAKITPCFENGKGGYATNLLNGIGFGSTEFHVLRAKENSDSKYIYQYTNFDRFRLAAEASMCGTGGQRRVQTDFVKTHKTQFPPLPEQQKIAKILTSVDEVIEKTQAQIDKLKDLKTGMMQELLTQGVGVDGKPHTEFKDSPVGRIPKVWDLEPLANFTTFISYGFTNPMPEAEVGPYMITAKDVNDLKVQYSTARKTTQEAFDNLLTRKSRPQVNDILLTKDGTLGRVALVTDSNCCINQSVAVLTPNERVIPKFLLYLLASPRYQQEMLENAGGSTIKHIYITVVDKMLVGVPSLIEQQKLVDIFDSVFRKLELTENKLSKLKDTKKALMQDLLTGKVRVNIE
ncbi:restriction endonuclease subunit S [Shewanella seohaensis]|uniref:restriction endonuclease subunit S n=1 Tax=Shewanella seohaensis TaxID=755175 RepID=UPI0035B78787